MSTIRIIRSCGILPQFAKTCTILRLSSRTTASSGFFHDLTFNKQFSSSAYCLKVQNEEVNKPKNVQAPLRQKEHLSLPEDILTSPHFKSRQQESSSSSDDSLGVQNYLLPHPMWSESEMDAVHVTHQEPKGKVDKLAYFSVKVFRTGFDVFSGFLIGERTEKKWLNRIMFLETVAGVPGMVAAMVRHLHALRRMQRDHGWIHTLLEEAENERMHLISAMMVKKPSVLFRGMVILAQGIFTNAFFVMYLISPRFCHRFVGYLEEEAVVTYTKLLDDIDSGHLAKWRTMPAPEMAINYWRLGEGGTMRDMVRAIRADEAHHREVNHILSDLKADEENPFQPGE